MSGPDPADPDAELMLRASQGDEAAFVGLVERWQQPVLNFVHRMLSDPDEAEDLTQAVFVQLWKTARRYRRQARFSTFLFTIARNLCLNEIRRRKRHPSEALPEAQGESETAADRALPDPDRRTAATSLIDRELVERVDEALSALPEKQRIALALCRDGELSYEEIAEVLDVTVPATKSLIHRARETMKLRLKPYLHTGAWSER